MATETIQFVALGEDEVVRAYETITNRARRARGEIERMFSGQASAARKAGQQSVAANDQAQAQMSRANQARLSQREQAEARVAQRERTVAAKRVRDYERELERKNRAHQRFMAKQARDEQRFEQRQLRQRRQLELREARELQRRRNARYNTAARGVGLFGNVAAIGAGVVGNLAYQSAKRNVATGDRARQISRQGRGVLSSSQVKDALDNSVANVRGATRQGSADVLSTFVSKTGDLKQGAALLDEINRIAIASNSDANDVAGVAASLYSNSDIKGLDQFREVLAGLVLQGKKGAVEFNTFATQVEKVSAGARKFNLTGVKGTLTAGALLQISKTSTGSVEEASTALDNVFTNLESKSGAIKRKTGARVFADKDKSKARDIRTVLAEVISGSKGNRQTLNEIFGKRGIRAVGGLVAAADEARAGVEGPESAKQKAAYDAVIATIERFSDTTGAAAEVQRDLAEAQQDSAARWRAATERLDIAFGKLVSPGLLAAAEQLESAMSDLSDFIERISGSPETKADTKAIETETDAANARADVVSSKLRQNALEAKVAKGTATSDEYDELKQLKADLPGLEQKAQALTTSAKSQRATQRNKIKAAADQTEGLTALEDSGVNYEGLDAVLQQVQAEQKQVGTLRGLPKSSPFLATGAESLGGDGGPDMTKGEGFERANKNAGSAASALKAVEAAANGLAEAMQELKAKSAGGTVYQT